ncbi:MAG: alpha/beta hydrolase, partial [Candidatus Hydrogenedentes bacterium]|nr:alpha/beta hydrolase [Candidatus Hydrogenedentota bacterium]
PAVVVCPGGGYGGLAIGHEGYDVARWLNCNGVSAFVLEYRVAPNRHPAPLDDAQAAMRLIRKRAGEWGIDPEKLGILGFSAGGHLASTVSTRFNPTPADKEISTRPDFSILIYPVITFLPPFGHTGSGNNLLGKDADPALVKSFNSQDRVTAATPPAFLVHSTGDSGVPSENSILYYQALIRAGVPAELHIYEQGEHGYGMGTDDPALSTWTDLCILWLHKRGILSE